MKKRLSEQIQELIDLLQATAEQVEDIKQKLRVQLAAFGPELVVAPPSIAAE
jgi:hypothetical protein